VGLNVTFKGGTHIIKVYQSKQGSIFVFPFVRYIVGLFLYFSVLLSSNSLYYILFYFFLYISNWPEVDII